MPNFEQARHNMVENQLRPSRIDDPRVLAAMASVRREAFVPAPLRGVAYGDDDIDLGGGRFLIEPLAAAKLIQTASLGPDDVALVIGCTTGYIAAVTSKLCATAFYLAPDHQLMTSVDELLSEMSCDNVVSDFGNSFDGLPSQAPYNVIIVAGAVSKIVESWREQLSEGGRLVTVVKHGGFGKVRLVTKLRGHFDQTEPCDARIPSLHLGPEQAIFAF